MTFIQEGKTMRRIKGIIFSGILAATVLGSTMAFTPQVAEAKVMWGKTELVKGQIGRVTIVKTTDLVKYDGKTVTTVRKLQPGQQFRVYSFKNYSGTTLLGVGAGQYIYRNENIKYETPSRSKLAQLAKETGALKQSPAQPDVAGKVYPDGWVAPVLESTWSSYGGDNLRTLENEIGFTDGGRAYDIEGVPNAIFLEGSTSGSYEVAIHFRMWDDDADGRLKQAYRIPIVAKELLKLYFAGDAMRVWNYLDTGDIPDQFIANGRTVNASYDANSGILSLEIVRKK